MVADRQMDRPTEKQTDRQIDRQTVSQTDIHKDRKKDGKTGRKTDRNIHRQTDRQTHRQTDRQANIRTDRIRDRQTEEKSISPSARKSSLRLSHWLGRCQFFMVMTYGTSPVAQDGMVRMKDGEDKWRIGRHCVRRMAHKGMYATGHAGWGCVDE